MSQPGKYIVIEGNDGTGKSTQVEILRRRLVEQGVESIEFHEPQGTPIADAIRVIIKNGTLPRDGITNLFLFSAARHEIWHTYALPALAEGKWVIASRNYFSTIAYQGYAEGLDTEVIKSVTRNATDERYMQPDIAVILDLDDETERRKRIGSRGQLENPDTFESKDSEFQSKIQAGYLAVAEQFNVPVVSASQPIDKVADDIWQIVSRDI